MVEVDKELKYVEMASKSLRDKENAEAMDLATYAARRTSALMAAMTLTQLITSTKVNFVNEMNVEYMRAVNGFIYKDR